MIDVALLDLMLETIQISPPTGRNSYGVPTYIGSTPVSYQCRIERRNRLVRKPDGGEVVSTATIYTAEPTNCSTEAQLTLPDASTARIISVERVWDEQGAYADVILI